MATSDQSPSSSSSATPSTNSDAGGPSFYSFNREPSGSSSSSTSTSRLRQEDEDRDRDRDRTQEQLYPPHFTQPEIEQQEIDVHVSGSLLLFDQASPISDDTWSCVIVVLTFWLFLSMTLILGVYGPASFSLGPNASLLIEPNPIFVQSIKVVEVDDKNPGPMLYGFYESPPLDVVENWSTVYTVSVPADSHEEWIFYLNEGSEIHISYNVNSTSSVFLVIAQGNEGLAEWLQDPAYPNTTLSWNIIQGSGTALQNIWRSSFYYVALGNMNSEQAEVDLNLTIRAFLYNTTTAFYNCNFADSMCSLEVLFPSGTPIVLTSPHPKQGSFDNKWNVKLSYGPRWATYILGLAGMTVLMLVAFKFLNNFQFIREEGGAGQFSETAPERTPFLSHKDDDLSSWGSSYDALSNDEEDCEDLLLAGGSLEGKPSRDGEDGNNNNTRRLCAICFDAPRDCFFLPCGHCVACFACGTRIVEAAGTCPICRRNMKKVRKIFTV